MLLIALPFGFWLVSGWTEPHELVRWKEDTVNTTDFDKAVLRGEQRAKERAKEEGRPYVDDRVPRVSVYSAPNVRPPEAAPTLKDLSDAAQAHAIDAIAQASGSQARPWEELRKALANGNQPGEKGTLPVRAGAGGDAGQRDALEGGRPHGVGANTRETHQFQVCGLYDSLDDTETVKVSSVEATDVRKLSPDIGLTVPGLGEAKISGLGVRENMVKTTSDIMSGYERLGIDITPEFLRIVRESGAGGDVVGNTRIALSLTTDPSLILKRNPFEVRQGDRVGMVNQNILDALFRKPGQRPGHPGHILSCHRSAPG